MRAGATARLKLGHSTNAPVHADAPVHVPVHQWPLYQCAHHCMQRCTSLRANAPARAATRAPSCAAAQRSEATKRAPRPGLILAAASTSSCTTPQRAAGPFALLVTSTVSSTPTRRFAVRTAAYANRLGCVPSAALSWYAAVPRALAHFYDVERRYYVCRRTRAREGKENERLDEQQRPVPSEILRSKAVSGNQAGLLTHTAHSPTA